MSTATLARPTGAAPAGVRLRVPVVVLALAAAALAMLLVGGAVSAPGGEVAAPGLIAQFGVSSTIAVSIVNALMSWWAVALSLVLVPLGLGFAAIAIRATWTTLVRTLGTAAAKTAMKRF